MFFTTSKQKLTISIPDDCDELQSSNIGLNSPSTYNKNSSLVSTNTNIKKRTFDNVIANISSDLARLSIQPTTKKIRTNQYIEASYHDTDYMDWYEDSHPDSE